MIGLYDHQGVLRFTGRDTADCLDYAELFELRPDGYSLERLSGEDLMESSAS
ncbi:hypothetical protein KBY66_07920 [Synechococcus sp. Tobar12-5m-g]|jgi:hypothetical protein|uniref:hypothetical protein n=1 Tax=unclassified Synechococcus TaxID=2626047 RepID=UPI0020CF0038|nr:MULTISPECIES: hypothetical protein [unclassified Synechococcus]MCP9772553.1 hypothetical protein [Synechococcus sp. Tobar12-5m-g]MCP9873392.1 hypothetical protein [Synechococcus sp. Cruz CV-v-12]